RGGNLPAPAAAAQRTASAIDAAAAGGASLTGPGDPGKERGRLGASPSRVSAAARRLVPVAVCALVAHAALYGALRPADAEHAYFRWYEPVVLGLALAGGAVLVAALALAALSRWRPELGRLPAALVGGRDAGERPGAAAGRL